MLITECGVFFPFVSFLRLVFPPQVFAELSFIKVLKGSRIIKAFKVLRFLKLTRLLKGTKMLARIDRDTMDRCSDVSILFSCGKPVLWLPARGARQISQHISQAFVLCPTASLRVCVNGISYSC